MKISVNIICEHFVLHNTTSDFEVNRHRLTIWVLVWQPGVLDAVVVFVAPLDALLSSEVLVRAGALLRVAHLVVERGARAVPAIVGGPEQ